MKTPRNNSSVRAREAATANSAKPTRCKAARTSKASKKTAGDSPTLPASQALPITDAQADVLERARMQWQFGDWESLVQMDEKVLESHPERAKLALLSASAHQQLNDHVSARHFTNLAKRWGCDKKTITRLLVAGVHNTLGRAAALAHDETLALVHFRFAIEGVAGDARLACQARAVREVARLGLYSRAGSFIEQQLGGPPEQLQLQHASPAFQRTGDTAMQQHMQSLAMKCLAAEDIHAAVDSELASPAMDPQGAFFFCIAMADEFKRRNDNLMAIHYLNTSRQYLDEGNPSAMALLSKRMLASGQHAVALDLLVKQTVNDASLDNREKAVLSKSYAQVRADSDQKIQHGHALLLTHLQENLATFRQKTGNRKPVLIEIGSTRENVAGQGSTSIIADYCKTERVDFITVDMDPHNTDSAAHMFKSLKTDFRAVNGKGEDFLRDYHGDMDFVFLDAYDFDHGKHSELRQSRYRKFLGSAIDELECHKMHLDCAQSVHAKLSAHGLVCVDDTWLVDGKWSAKGTLAVPYLLDNGFEVIEARNRAALLRRKGSAG